MKTTLTRDTRNRVATAQPTGQADDVRLMEHTLNRLGYGHSPRQRDLYDQLGFEEYVSVQLQHRGGLPAWDQTPGTVAGKLTRGIGEQRQLQALLSEFWVNHFNVNAKGGLAKHQINVYLNETIRPNVLGAFGTLLYETSRAPSMLGYLDNRRNAKPGIVYNGKEFGPNQNYAREIMELHTLGVDGGYSQEDVLEATRILSGWSTEGTQAAATFIYRDDWHDKGAKLILKQSFPANGGQDEIVQFLDLLAGHPSTARRVALRLCQLLIRDNPSNDVVASAARRFTETDGSIAHVIADLIGSSDFQASKLFRTKIKSPNRFIISAGRAMGVPANMLPLDDLVVMMETIGDVPYQFPAPTGYPVDSRYWLTADGMLGRFNMAEAMTSVPEVVAAVMEATEISRSDRSDIVAKKLIDLILPSGVSTATADIVAEAAEQSRNHVIGATKALQMTLCSPEFLRY